MALALCIVMFSTATIFASSIKDVPANHWAYKDIIEMQRRGLLVTNSKGEFFPNNYVTYFEFSQILAKATGYQNAAVNPNMDPTLKKQIEDNYAKQKGTIEAHAKNYKHWQKDADQEIAYLLGKGYLAKEDLGKFMSKSTSGVESKRGVRKQEATTFLVRILHKAETAKDEYVSTGFIDEATIEAAYRPYVAYMKKLGIINGNEKGQFGPSEPITRATLSKMLVETLKVKEAPPAPEVPTTPELPTAPQEQALEGKLTKMISNGSDGYYVVLEIEPGTSRTFSIKDTASITDTNGYSVSLPSLKNKIDTKENGEVIVVAKIELLGTTEYMTQVKMIQDTGSYLPPVEEEEKPEPERPERPRPSEPDKEKDTYTGQLIGSIHSILFAPGSELTIETDNKKMYTFDIGLDTKIYSDLKRKDISPWDLRLNQGVELKVVNGEITRLDVTKAAPPITLTGVITKTSTNGDQIEMRIAYDATTQQENRTKTINVPMATQILSGTAEKNRKDLKEGMKIVVVYGENEEVIPEQILILAN